MKMAGNFAESVVESAALKWFENIGYKIIQGVDVAPGEFVAERKTFQETFLVGRFRDVILTLNPTIPPEALEDAFRKLTRPEGPTLETRNRAFHKMLVDGVPVEYRRPDGFIAGAQAKVIDFAEPGNNDWLVVNQFTVAENKHTRRPDFPPLKNALTPERFVF